MAALHFSREICQMKYHHLERNLLQFVQNKLDCILLCAPTSPPFALWLQNTYVDLTEIFAKNEKINHTTLKDIS